ncbi:MAG TPA: TCR/Tet family MFS transporter [Casimicrobiaceae bacterium]|nr:TCR/Tet family MFS transporter [Casimicrobiaceae bacterium]
MNFAKLPAHGRAAFAFVLVTVLLDMLALGVMVPVLPKLIIEFMGGDIASAATIAGVFGFTWAAMQFVFSPVLGALSDRIGRRPVIILSNIGMGLDYVVMALAPSLWFLFAGRLLSGISSASSATAGAYITDITPPEKRAAQFGMLGAAFGFGFVVGPAMGGFLGAIDLRLPFWVAAGLSFANAVYGYCVLPESLPRERRSRFHWRMANPIGSLRLLKTKPILVGLAIAMFLERVAHDALPRVFVLYTDYRYQWGAATVGLALAAVGMAQVVVSGGLVGMSVKRVGERQTLLLGLLFGIAGFILYGLAPTGAWFMAGVPLVALGGLAGPAMQGLMTREIGASDQGKLQGALASLQGVAGLIGPLLFTQTFALAIRPGGAVHLPGAPYLLAAALVLIAMIAAVRVTRPRAPNPAVEQPHA